MSGRDAEPNRNEKRSKLTSGNHEGIVFPLTPPVDLAGNARTVLAGKGSLTPRQKAARPCLLRAGSGAEGAATGGSGGKTIEREFWSRDPEEKTRALR